ncbi:hypothetical protein BDV96DRAFT_643997 [Lophiotrema nucula]|uniref:BTB domain-containing protein n=1 Tax=Lophiotrema nucula TaxID=690887 RepID=A0A6A5ZEI7_9PLEO|nr:hypothetical protein BDV96DRAFT_643997 [Lophiotrema nucula]
MITVKSADDKIEQVPKELLMHESKYFRAALTREFREAQEKEICLTYSPPLPLATLIAEAYSKLPQSSPFIRLLVDFMFREDYFTQEEAKDIDRLDPEVYDYNLLPKEFFMNAYLRHTYVCCGLKPGKGRGKYQLHLCNS